MTPYRQYQISKYGNYIGADGLLHTGETANMIDETEELENGFAEMEELNRWFQEQGELQLMENN